MTVRIAGGHSPRARTRAGIAALLWWLLPSPAAAEPLLPAPAGSPAMAARARAKPGARRTKQRRRRPAEVTVPIDVGVGPNAIVPSPPAMFDQPVHTGMVLSLAAVVDQATIRRFKDQIPPELRQQAMTMDEVRIRPWYLALIPDVLILSPPFFNTGMYGAVWHPIGIGLPLLKDPVRFTLGADLALCYLFMHSRTLPQPTHFLRPGLGLRAVLQIPLSDTFLVSTGWASDLYLPQPLGQPPWVFWPLDASLWHLGGPFLKFHVRIPFTTTM
ncbi:MAG: hypothetical protein ABIJ09_13480 [Pseudomonadota bacterium]